MTTLIVLAKPCVPGRVKTRLHPPLTLVEAARVAEASLADTLAQADGAGFTRRVLCFDGDREQAPQSVREDPTWEVLRQSGGPLDARIAAAFDACSDGPAVLIGMDTPQLDAALLDRLARKPWPADAVFGPAVDGGFWLLGLSRPDGDLVRGVPMSRDDTGARQRERLVAAGLRVHELPKLCDIDTITALRDVAAMIPERATANVLRTIDAMAAACRR